MKKSSRISVSEIASLGVFAAVAYVLTFVSRFLPAPVPAVPFLKFDPKDFIIVIAGFLFGPLQALAITVVVSLIEMVTISTTGYIGLIMNILSTSAFVVPASLVYRSYRKPAGAIIGLALGSLVMTGVMLLWNYLITPLYMTVPREAVAKLLLPAFLPFNLIKAAINTALALLLYKPLAAALRKARVLPESTGKRSVGATVLFVILGIFLLISVTLVILVINGLV